MNNNQDIHLYYLLLLHFQKALLLLVYQLLHENLLHYDHCHCMRLILKIQYYQNIE